MVNLLLQVSGRNESGSIIGGFIYSAVCLAVFIVVIAGSWKMLEKAKQPGWGILIPIYNMVLLCRVAGKPGWWVILMIIPLVNIIISVLVAAGIARNFGKGVGYTLGLIFLPIIFYSVLGFGDAKYAPENPSV